MSGGTWRFVQSMTDAVIQAVALGAQWPTVDPFLFCAHHDDADPAGNEPVFDGDRVIGVTTGGTYGFSVGKSLAFAYVEPGYASPGSAFDISILGSRRRATVLDRPAYDPGNQRLRS